MSTHSAVLGYWQSLVTVSVVGCTAAGWRRWVEKGPLKTDLELMRQHTRQSFLKSAPEQIFNWKDNRAGVGWFLAALALNAFLNRKTVLAIDCKRNGSLRIHFWNNYKNHCMPQLTPFPWQMQWNGNTKADILIPNLSDNHKMWPLHHRNINKYALMFWQTGLESIPSVRRAFPPVGWQRTVEQPTHNTTVWAWLNTVVIL